MSFTCGSITYADPSGDWVAAQGKIAHKHIPGGPVYEREPIVIPGVDGVAFRKNGFRAARFVLQVYYVDSSAAALATAIFSDLKTLAADPVTVNSIPACYLMPESGQAGPCRRGNNGCVFALVNLVFEQRRLA